MLTAEQLLQVADTLTATGAFYRYRMRLDERHASLLELMTGIEDHGSVAKPIHGCIEPPSPPGPDAPTRASLGIPDYWAIDAPRLVTHVHRFGGAAGDAYAAPVAVPHDALATPALPSVMRSFPSGLNLKT